MRHSLVLPLMFLCPAIVAPAQVSIGINLPGLSIGINQPVYPELVPVPGYPVYYAPGSNSNFFFYDGLYWVYQGNEWYSSAWYNGPWTSIDPNDVPLYVLRVPVMYYRQPPPYFGGWDRNAPPRWGEHWGQGWEQRRGGWDHWDHNARLAPAPLPVYQRQFSGDRYPRPDQQQALRTQNYRYQPKEAVSRASYQPQKPQAAPAPAPHQQGPRPEPSPHQQPVSRGNGPIPPAAQQPPPRPNTPPAAQRPQPAPAQPQNHEAPRGNPGQEQNHEAPHGNAGPGQNHEAPHGNAGQEQHREAPGKGREPT